MIPQNKINKMKEELLLGKTPILVFSFIDGIYYIKLTNENIMNLNENQGGGRFDRGSSEYKQTGYCFINIKDLTKI